MAYFNRWARIPPTVRFWARVDKRGACWLWQGAATPHGYGYFSLEGRRDYAHRVSYRWAYGEIPEGAYVCHHCDTPACVRPEHLFLGSQQDNLTDAARKGRMHGAYTQRSPGKRGEDNHLARLTAAQVRAIRARYAAGGESYATLARAYGINPSNVGAIITRRSWQHLD